ncbi:MAG TPA: hypothetical protein VMT87_05440, partial [Vicinamibacteria bacterium]|nr:hypothetical protein [Vicinamibacteria bacterium]
MRTEIIRDWASLGQLEGEWNTLLSSSRADTIFLRWQWIQAWGEAVGRAHPLLVVVARDSQGALAGVAPFYQSTLRLFGRVPFRTLRLLGDYPTGSEYPDWIVRLRGEDEAITALAHALTRARREWDCIWMPNMSGWTGAIATASRVRAYTGPCMSLNWPIIFSVARVVLSTAGRTSSTRRCIRVRTSTGWTSS